MIVVELVLRVLTIVVFGTLGVLGGGPIVNAVFRRVDDGVAPPSVPWRRRRRRGAEPPTVALRQAGALRDEGSDSPTVAIDTGPADTAVSTEGGIPPDATQAEPSVQDEGPIPVVAVPAGGPSGGQPERPGAEPTDGEHRPPGLIAAGARLPGGAWIGFLERLAIFASLVFGFPQGVALALALKGLARYPEIRAQAVGTGERFIIGTFVSVLVACAAALVTLWLLGYVGRIA